MRKSECLHCGAKMVTQRFFFNPGRVKVVCVGCEAIIPVNLTSETLAAHELADEVTALD